MPSKHLLGALFIGAAMFSSNALAESPRIVTWNINGGEQDKDILADNAAEMASDLGDFDVLVLQEVISSQQVAAIAENLGFDYWAISDFSPPVEVTGKWFRSLEVAVISKTPFVRAVEWDPTGPLPTGDPYDPRVSNTAVPTESLELDIDIDNAERPSRGFLRVDLQDGPSVYAVHWKSSGGDSGDADLQNAAKRENNARGVATDARKVLGEGRSVIIAGDFNIQPIGKHTRVGTDVSQDCTPSQNNCGSGGMDGYDDSMTILAEIGNGYRLLSAELPPTYLRGNFGPGAIDHIAVAGDLASEFSDATTAQANGDSYFGSDHSPVVSDGGIVTGSIGSKSSRDEQLTRLVREVRERLEIIERLTNQ